MNNSLSFRQFAYAGNFGHSIIGPAYTLRPNDVDQIPGIFPMARRNGLTVTPRGAGRSYNDAAMNSGNVILDLQDLDRILEWHPDTGIIQAEPGVTLKQIWQRVLPDGWWPPVVSGTMKTTLGGCLGMNIHGKNNYRVGTIGDHVLEFTVLLPTGAHLTCSPQKNADLFYAMISGMGMLGIFTSITLQMKPVETGLLEVKAWNFPDLKTGMADIESRKDTADYIVGWVDCTTSGRNIGRGQIHEANYLKGEAVSDPRHTLQIDFQTLPPNVMGIIPKSIIHYLMRPFLNNFGVRTVNTAKYLAGRTKTYHQSHAEFHFLLDFVPNWELAYGQHGMIQYQSFIPKETALDAFHEILNLSNRRKLPTYLGVLKRHRSDSQFLISHAVDGYSLAMDFRVTRSNRDNLRQMLQDFDKIVIAAGGRFYFAKNSETTPGTAMAFLGEERINRFRRLKQRCDPDSLLKSDLYRRIFSH